MERDNLQRRATYTVKQMGVNSYSQIISAFRAQGDLTNEKLSIIPVLQNVFGITRERHTAEVKRALNDEHLSDIVAGLHPSSGTSAWENQAGYSCSNVVHRPPITETVHLAEQILKTTPPTTIIQHAPSTSTTKLNSDLKQAMKDIAQCDGVLNATPPQPNNTLTRQKSNQFNSTEINGLTSSRLSRPKQQGTKPKSSIDTLIEVVQKDLLRVPEHPSTQSPTKESFMTKQQIKISTSSNLKRPAVNNISRSASTDLNYTLKITPKVTANSTTHLKRLSSYQQQQQQQQQHKTIHFDHSHQRFEDDKTDVKLRPHIKQVFIKSEQESIEDIVHDVLNTIISTITGETNSSSSVNSQIPDTKSSNMTDNAESYSSVKLHAPIVTSLSVVKTEHSRADHTIVTPTPADTRTSPIKVSQQLYHSPLVLQPNNSSTTSSSTPNIPVPTSQALFVAPRIINFQSVVPKQTTNIQIGNTKIILVSPSNITQHLPHTTTTTNSSTSTQQISSTHQIQQQPQQQTTCLLNKSPVKFVKFNTNTNSNPLQTRTTPLSINSNPQSALTLAKNVQIVIPSQNSAALQLARSQGEDLPKPINTSSSTSFRPINTVSVAFTPRPIDHIPQATQEVTISTSPNTSPSSITNVSKDFSQTTTNTTSGGIVNNTERVSPSRFLSQQALSSVGHVTTTRTSPLHDETIKPVSLNIATSQSGSIPRTSSTHGPMIYRMTSVNQNVPVFRLRTATTPTQTTVINKSLKTEPKPIAMTTATNVCYEPKQNHSAATTSGAVSVLACFKTTKKRPKERAIMPRPSTSELNDSSHENHQQRSNSGSSSINLNVSQITSCDLQNSNGSFDYPSSFSATTRLLPQMSVSSTFSDDILSTHLSSSIQDSNHDATMSSNDSIPVALNHSASLEETSISIQNLKSPSTINNSLELSPLSSIPSISNTQLEIIDNQNVQIIDENNFQSVPLKTTVQDSENKKRKEPENDEWIENGISLLKDLLLRNEFQSFDSANQQDLTTKFNFIQTSLITGFMSTIDEFHQAVLQTKREFITETSSNEINRPLEEFFDYFQNEFDKISQSINETKRHKCDSPID